MTARARIGLRGLSRLWLGLELAFPPGLPLALGMPLALASCSASQAEARAAAAARADRLAQYQVRAQQVAAELDRLGFPVRASEVTVDIDAAARGMDAETAPAVSANSRAALESLRRLLGLDRPLNDAPPPARAAGPPLPVQYDPAAQALVFHEPLSPEEPAFDFALAHALAHAHQDQSQGGVEAFLQLHDHTLDESRVARALLEGQALLLGHAVLLQRRGLDAVALDPAVLDTRRGDLLGGEGSGVLTAAGLRFALWVYRQGGWPALQAAYRRPPTSSEQLLHPAKYRLDTPRIVTLPEWPYAADPVEKLAGDVLGELALYATLSEALERAGEPGARASEAAALGCVGWEGDRFEAYELADGRRAVLWRSVWDLEESAQAFARVLGRAAAINAVQDETLSLRRRGSVVDVAFSEDPSYLTPLARALAAHIYDFPPDLADSESTRAAGAELVARFAPGSKVPALPGEAGSVEPSADAPDQ